jgi:putative oxidoreductase
LRLSRWLLGSGCPRGVVLIRTAVGTVFVSEGIQKFLYPAALGVGRFAKIGIPAPELMGHFVGVVEILCGALVLAGLLTRIAALLLIADMAVAILSTKIPILLGHGYWRFAGPSPTKTGLWSMLHEARTDLSMLLASLFLLLVGGGRVSLDAFLLRGGPKGRRPDKRP